MNGSSKFANNKERIKSLINNKQLVLPKSMPIDPPKCGKLDSFVMKQISENALLGSTCGAIVIGKDEAKKELYFHIMMIYDGVKGVNISGNKYLGFMKDYELKADSSIFTYINGFAQIETGALINAWVRRIEKREITQDITKNYMELVLSKQTSVRKSDVRMGVVKDHIKIPDSIMKVYEKEGTFPINFQMLYLKQFDNPGLANILLSSLKVEALGSMHRISNLEFLKSIDYRCQRIRFSQESAWGDQHLNEGIENIQEGNNQAAIQCFNIAKRFDPKNINIYIGKACALYNIKNTAEALQLIKQALKLEPNNERAKKYYEKFRAELTEKPELRNKSSSGFELVFKK